MATLGEVYGPAMEIVDQDEADRYFEKLVERNMAYGANEERARQVVRSNLGYYAGYYSAEVRDRVERLFKCAHPVFGAISEKGQPTAEEVIELGKELGRKIGGKN